MKHSLQFTKTLSAKTILVLTACFYMSATSANFAITSDPIVEIEGFGIVQKGNKISLTWATMEEEGITGFEIERTQDIGTERWVSIGFVHSQGDSKYQQDYIFDDTKPMVGLTYYRIKAVGYNQNTIATNPLQITMNPPASKNPEKIYPNPLTGAALLYIILPPEYGESMGTVYTTSGQMVMQFPISSSRFVLSTAELPKGFFILSIEGMNGNRTVRKIMN